MTITGQGSSGYSCSMYASHMIMYGYFTAVLVWEVSIHINASHMIMYASHKIMYGYFTAVLVWEVSIHINASHMIMYASHMIMYGYFTAVLVWEVSIHTIFTPWRLHCRAWGAICMMRGGEIWQTSFTDTQPHFPVSTKCTSTFLQGIETKGFKNHWELSSILNPTSYFLLTSFQIALYYWVSNK